MKDRTERFIAKQRRQARERLDRAARGAAHGAKGLEAEHERLATGEPPPSQPLIVVARVEVPGDDDVAKAALLAKRPPAPRGSRGRYAGLLLTLAAMGGRP